MSSSSAREFLPGRYLGELIEKGMPFFVVLAAVGFGVLASVSAKMALVASGLLLLLIFILPSPIRGLYAIVAFLPFENLTALRQDFSIIKVITIVIFVTWLARLIRTKRTAIHLARPENLFLLGFSGFAVIALAGMSNFTYGLGKLATLFLLIAFYFLVSDLASDEKILRTILWILVVSGALSAVFAVGEFLMNPGIRVEGTFGSESRTAIFLLVLVPLVVYFLSQATGRGRFLLWSVFFVTCAGVVFTRSRGSIIALAVMILLMALSRLTEVKIRRAFFALLLIGALLLPFAEAVDNRFSMKSIAATRGSGRFSLWSTGYQVLSDNWLFGVGFGNFGPVYRRYAAHEPSIPYQHIVPLGAHNLLLEEGAETGIFGLMAFLGFIGFSLHGLLKATRQFQASKNGNQALASSMIFISIIGFLVASMSYTAITMKIGWVLLALAASQVNLAGMRSQDETASRL